MVEEQQLFHVTIKPPKFVLFLQTSTLPKSGLKCFWQDESTPTGNVQDVIHRAIRTRQVILFLVYWRAQSSFSPIYKTCCTYLFIREVGQNISFASTLKRAFEFNNCGFGPQVCCLQGTSAQQYPCSLLFIPSPTFRLHSSVALWLSSGIEVMCASPGPAHQNLPRHRVGWRHKGEGILHSYMEHNSISLIPPIPADLHGPGCEREINFKTTNVLEFFVTAFGLHWQIRSVTALKLLNTSLNSVSPSINWGYQRI